MKTNIKKYAAHIGAAAVVITAVASAAVTPLPGSLPASVANGDIIEASHINDILSSLNILDQRTDGDAPVDNVDIVNKGYLDTAVSAAGDWQKGEICPTGELMIGYNADGTIACDTAENLGLGGGGGSTAPDVTGLTGFGTIVQVSIEGRNFGLMSNETFACSDLGIGWHNPYFLSPSAYSLTSSVFSYEANQRLEPSILCSGDAAQAIRTDNFTAAQLTGCNTAQPDAISKSRLCEYKEIL